MADTIIVGVAEAHNRLSELLRMVKAGTIVNIARHGTVEARLVPPPITPPTQPGLAANVLALIKQQEHGRPTLPCSDEYVEDQMAVERDAWNRDSQ